MLRRWGLWALCVAAAVAMLPGEASAQATGQTFEVEILSLFGGLSVGMVTFNDDLTMDVLSAGTVNGAGTFVETFDPATNSSGITALGDTGASSWTSITALTMLDGTTTLIGGMGRAGRGFFLFLGSATAVTTTTP